MRELTKMRTLKRRRLPADVYRRCITLLYGTLPEINAALKKDCPIDFVPLHPYCEGHWKCYVHAGFEADYLCVVWHPSREHMMAVLGHEALHCASHALRTAGIAHTEDTEEAYCYYQQWLVEQCADIMRGRKP